MLAADLRDAELLQSYRDARERLMTLLKGQFPEFDWQMPLVERRTFPPRGALKPLPLLEIGAEEKLYRRWDFAFVVVPNELEPRRRIRALGVPSSALEVAVLSSNRLGEREVLAERVAALALHLFGHLLSLETESTGPMCPPDPDGLVLEPFDAEQINEVRARLHDVTDMRLEETTTRWNTLSFYWRVFWSDPPSIFKSILGYSPWRIPLYLGRLTAAVVVSLLVLLLTAESWEAGANVSSGWLLGSVVVAIILSSVFIFFGQHIGQVGRGRGWSEQLARSRIVLFGTLLVGMMSLYAELFILLYCISFALPLEVISGWSGFAPEDLPRIKYVAFLSSIGILAGALGGNLEEEEAIKAELFFDEEV